jgi:hypothetical protein
MGVDHFFVEGGMWKVECALALVDSLDYIDFLDNEGSTAGGIGTRPAL